MTELEEPKFADSEAEDLFSRMILAVPEAMKNMVKPMLLGLAGQKAGGGPITIEALKEMVEGLPEPQKSVFKQVVAARKGLDPEVIKAMIEECGGDIPRIFFKIMERMKYIPQEAVREIAKQTGISEAHLFHLITTGKAFFLSSSAHQVTLCAGTGCTVKDKSKSLETIEKLVTDAGSKEVLLKKARCLGCCDSGPLAEIDGKRVALNVVQAQIEAFLKG
jgi:NADH:ubiquinone oxidoreductase subunit E